MSSDQRIRHGTVFRLSRELGSLPDSLLLLNLEWGLLLAITGEHTVAQIGDHFGLEVEDRDTAFRRLLSLGLIEEQAVSFSEYVRASATIADHEPRTLARFLRSGVALAGAPGGGAGQNPAPPTPSSSGRAAVTGVGPRGVVRAAGKKHSSHPVPPVASSPPAPPPPKPASPEPASPVDLTDIPVDSKTRAIPTGSLSLLAFEPLADVGRTGSRSGPASLDPGGVASEVSVPVARRLSFKALMQWILHRAPDLSAGQLDIYRVFIRVDTRLLKRHGIHTLRFTEDHRIADPELEEAIAFSLKQTLGIHLPESVFV